MKWKCDYSPFCSERAGSVRWHVTDEDGNVVATGLTPENAKTIVSLFNGRNMRETDRAKGEAFEEFMEAVRNLDIGHGSWTHGCWCQFTWSAICKLHPEIHKAWSKLKP